jgi:hypothetical protein
MDKAISAGDGLGLKHDEGYVTRCKVTLVSERL